MRLYLFNASYIVFHFCPATKDLLALPQDLDSMSSTTHRITSCLDLSCRVVSCRVVPCRAVSCRVLSCRVVSCLVLSCLSLVAVLSYLVLSSWNKCMPFVPPPLIGIMGSVLNMHSKASVRYKNIPRIHHKQLLRWFVIPILCRLNPIQPRAIFLLESVLHCWFGPFHTAFLLLSLHNILPPNS